MDADSLEGKQALLTEIRASLEQIAELTTGLIADDAPLTDDQIDNIRMIEYSARNMSELTPMLEELMLTRNYKQAVAQMSTEWRTPLISIMAYAQMVLMGLSGTLNDEQRAWVQMIEANARKLLDWASANEQSA